MELLILASPVTPDVRKALQSATAHLHAEVDSALPLALPAPTLADYFEHLAVLLDWTAVLQLAHPALAGRLDPHRQRLQQDLGICVALLSEVPAAPSRPELAAPVATADDAAIDWGVAYVIEGSQLGGQVLYRRLADRLAPHPLGYLKGAGSHSGRQWTAFLTDLRAQVVTPRQQQAACRGAVQAFEALLHCFRARRANARVAS